MKKLLILSSLILASVTPAQELGGAWFISKGSSEPVVLAGIGRVDDVFGLSWLDLDFSALVRPEDGLRLGGAITLSTPIARNAWATFGVGGLFSERFQWSSIRPGLVLGVTVRL